MRGVIIVGSHSASHCYVPFCKCFPTLLVLVQVLLHCVTGYSPSPDLVLFATVVVVGCRWLSLCGSNGACHAI
jgi:hypothetical protein